MYLDIPGADMAVRPNYPVTPDNALTELPKAAKAFRDEGLFIGLVSTPTNLNDPDSAAAQMIFEASVAEDKQFVALEGAAHFLTPLAGSTLADPVDRLLDIIVPWLRTRLN